MLASQSREDCGGELKERTMKALLFNIVFAVIALSAWIASLLAGMRFEWPTLFLGTALTISFVGPSAIYLTQAQTARSPLSAMLQDQKRRLKSMLRYILAIALIVLLFEEVILLSVGNLPGIIVATCLAIVISLVLLLVTGRARVPVRLNNY